jgi:hypothetical protein
MAEPSSLSYFYAGGAPSTRSCTFWAISFGARLTYQTTSVKMMTMKNTLWMLCTAIPINALL